MPPAGESRRVRPWRSAWRPVARRRISSSNTRETSARPKPSACAESLATPTSRVAATPVMRLRLVMSFPGAGAIHRAPHAAGLMKESWSRRSGRCDGYDVTDAMQRMLLREGVRLDAHRAGGSDARRAPAHWTRLCSRSRAPGLAARTPPTSAYQIGRKTRRLSCLRSSRSSLDPHGHRGPRAVTRDEETGGCTIVLKARGRATRSSAATAE